MRSKARPPGSTLTMSGSARVRRWEEGVVFDVVEIGRRGRGAPSHLHARHRRLRRCACSHLHAGHRHLRRRGRRAAADGRLAGHRPGFLQALENLLRRSEAEIGQQHHDFLLVGAVALIADDERRGQKELLLQPFMRVHPERAAEGQREIVIGARPRRNGRSGNAWHPVLRPGRRQPVPMNETRFVEAVLDPDAKGLADVDEKAGYAVRLADAVDGSRLAVHHDFAWRYLEDRRRRLRPRDKGGARRGPPRLRRGQRDETALELLLPSIAQNAGRWPRARLVSYGTAGPAK